MISNCKSLFKSCSCVIFDDNNYNTTIIDNEYIGSVNQDKETQTTNNDIMLNKTNNESVIHKTNNFYITNTNKPKLTTDKIKKIIITKTSNYKTKP
jgi:hypothetical protein